MILFKLLFSFFAFTASAADTVPVHGFTPEQNAFMVKHNEAVAANAFLAELFGQINTDIASVRAPERPFAEYEDAGYLIFSDADAFGAYKNKLAMAKNVPSNVTVVVYTASQDINYQKQLFNDFAKYIAKERLKVIYLPNANSGFWSRDGIPVPKWTMDASGKEKLKLVDARYYYPFEPDKQMGEFFQADLTSLAYYHEGGNFMNNSRGDCVIVNNERAVKIPDNTFKDAYACKTLIRVPHLKGIGHIDECLKFIDDDTIITDTPEYVDTLEKAGFKVTMLPRPDNEYETYANALVVNGVAFVPVFNQAQDADALNVYQSMGLKTVPLNSTSLSNDGLGSLHCITMTYPPVEFNTLLKHLSSLNL